MDMRIIEVAIGLVLVFAISSLLVSTLHEIWTALRKSRGDSLLLGLCSLLGDDDVTMGQLRRRFSPKSQPSPFTRSLLAHPLLVSQSLGGAGSQNMPSYLPSDVFINALISQLSTLAGVGVRSADPQTWLNAVKASADAKRASGDAYQPKPALLTTLATLLQGVENDWPSFEARLRAWYDSVQQRAGGWYRRDTQLRLVVIGFLVAYLANLNPFVIAPRLWNDPVVRAAAVGVAQDAAKAYATAASAPASAASDPSLALLTAINKQLAQATPRSKAAAPAKGASAPATTPTPTPQALESEQALRALKDHLFAASENPRLHPAPHDAEAVRSSLDRLLDLQDQVRLRQRLATERADPLLLLDASVAIDDHLAALKAQWPDAKPGSGPHALPLAQLARLTTALRNERDVLLPPRVTLSPAAGAAAQRVALACVSEGGVADKLCEPLGAVQQLAGSGLPIGWGWANWPGCDAACQARQRPGVAAPAPSASAPADRYADSLTASRVADPASSAPPEASRHLRKLYQAQHTALASLAARGADKSAELTPFLWRHWARDDFQQGLWQALLGWLIIGIGASLGAPFWFDLLGRFVKLRGSGTVAAPGVAGDATTPPADTMTRTPPPARGAPPANAAGAAPPPDTNALNAAEGDLTPAQIVRLQRALGLAGTEATGTLDASTRLRIVQWQQARGDAASHGELNAAQIGDLLSPAAPPAAAPGGAPPASTTPRRTNGTINVLTEAEVRALYGDIATRPLANGAVEVVSKGSAGQAQHEIVEFRHALLGAQQPQHVHARALPHFVDAFDRIQSAIAAGTVPGDVIVNCGGTYVPRHIDSDPTRPLSRHTWGIAIDLNTQANGMNAQPAALGTPGSLLSIVPIFNACGFAWGGHFSTGPDGMHFELALRNP